jgi:hypothetical protein
VQLAILSISAQRCSYLFLAAILEPPENQYILEDTCKAATLICNVQGAHAYWFINGNATNHVHHKSYYNGLGVIFNNSKYTPNYINLTMTVPACLATKVSNIECVAKDRLFQATRSDKVRITVFKSFRK